MKELYCVVSGNIQGVFYRKFVQEKALELGLTGYAKNMEDGTVEVVAQGPEADLRKFLEPISAGKEDSEVDNITVSFGPIPDKLEGFQIL